MTADARQLEGDREEQDLNRSEREAEQEHDRPHPVANGEEREHPEPERRQERKRREERAPAPGSIRQQRRDRRAAPEAEHRQRHDGTSGLGRCALGQDEKRKAEREPREEADLQAGAHQGEQPDVLQPQEVAKIRGEVSLPRRARCGTGGAGTSEHEPRDERDQGHGARGKKEPPPVRAEQWRCAEEDGEHADRRSRRVDADRTPDLTRRKPLADDLRHTTEQNGFAQPEQEGGDRQREKAGRQTAGQAEEAHDHEGRRHQLAAADPIDGQAGRDGQDRDAQEGKIEPGRHLRRVEMELAGDGELDWRARQLDERAARVGEPHQRQDDPAIRRRGDGGHGVHSCARWWISNSGRIVFAS